MTHLYKLFLGLGVWCYFEALLPKSFYFSSKFPDKLNVDVFVDSWFVDDVLGSVGVSEGGQGLPMVDLCR